MAAAGFSLVARRISPQIFRSFSPKINLQQARRTVPLNELCRSTFALQHRLSKENYKLRLGVNGLISPKSTWNSGKFNSSTMSKAFIQKPAPPFSGTAVNHYGEFVDIKLSDFKGKYVVLFFYPLNFTFVCPTEIIAFSDRVQEFEAINCSVIACSVDSHFSHLAWTNQPRKKGGLGKMQIPLLSDITKQISKDYGVLLEDQGVALRGLFIIDDKGILRQITMNDLPVGRSVDEVLRLVQAFKFTDEHGEVCPAGWRPGGDTIVPDTKNSEKFFSKQ